MPIVAERNEFDIVWTSTKMDLAFLEHLEFSIWQKHLPKSVVVTNLGDITREARANGIKRWSKVGGVLLVGEKTFVNVASQKMGLQEYLQPDVLVLDEAHMMLKNPKNKVYETLTAIKTPRKIGKCGLTRGFISSVWSTTTLTHPCRYSADRVAFSKQRKCTSLHFFKAMLSCPRSQ